MKILFALFAVLLAFSVPVSAQQQPAPADCAEFGLPEATDGITCYRVEVPLWHDEPDGGSISLAVARIAPMETEGPADPLFMAQGGPGGATIGTYAAYLISTPGSRPTANREIVLWDQRGTGFSQPLLNCPELQQAELEAAAADPSDETTVELTALSACGARLVESGVDLSAFNSVENARDVDTIRMAFGFDAINFYGVSYGSELAQFVIREVPTVRSAILDAVVPISYDLLTEPARAQQMIGEKYLLGCRDHPTCDAAFPDLAERYVAMIDRLNADPVALTIYPLEGERREIQVQLTGDLFENTLFSALYSNVTSIVPLIVDRADSGDFALTAAVLLPSQLGASDIAEAMHITVVCAERSKTNTAPDFTGILPRIVETTLRDAATAEATCDAWGVDALPPEQVAPVTSDTPMLLLSGEFDPITPPVYAETLLPQFPKASHVVFSGGTHGQAVTSDCANRIIAAFLDEPESTPETECLPAAAPEFVTDDDVIFVGLLNRSIATSGIMGIAQAAMAQLPALVIGVFLILSWLFYPIAHLIRRLAGHPRADLHVGLRWAGAAPPWMTLLAGIAILGTIGALSGVVASTLMTNEYLGIMGAIPRSLAPVLVLPWVVVGIVTVMAGVAVVIWRHRLRSLPGRVGFSFTTLVAALGAVSLVLLVR